jgi:hypothetical protein
MSAKSFKFISPGIFLNEIDNSELPAQARDIGPLVIGRTTRGPAMRPVTVDSFEDFVQIYGTPNAGNEGSDVWRNGSVLSPTYASYAAQAWLKNSSTITVVRLGGSEHINKASSTTVAAAGWKTTQDYFTADPDIEVPATNTTNVPGASDAGGAYGLWVFDSKISGSATQLATGSLAAVWYVQEGSVGLKGKSTFTGSVAGVQRERSFALAEFVSSDGAEFTVVVSGSVSALTEEVKFSFVEGSKNYIRDVFNTNPTLTNPAITPPPNRRAYWLGETYTNELTTDYISTSYSKTIHTGSADNSYWGMILQLSNEVASDINVNHATQKRQFTDAETGWYFHQDLSSATANYEPYTMDKLFKFVGLGHGEWLQKNIKITIENIRQPQNIYVKYGTFDVLLRNIADSDTAKIVVERFSNCNLDPSSPDFIGNKIGTQYYVFDPTKRRLSLRGAFPNRSKYVRVELDPLVESAAANKEYIPYGVYGPTKYRDFHYTTGQDFVTQCLTSSQGACALVQSQDAVGRGGIVTGSSGAEVGGLLEWSGSSHPWDEDGEEYNIRGNYTALAVDVGSRYKFAYPRIRVRKNTAQDNLPVYTQASFGAWTGQSDNNTNFNNDVLDLVRPVSSLLTAYQDPSTTNEYLEYQYVFTLDDIYYDSVNDRYAYEEGKRRAGLSITALSGAAATLSASIGINSFTTLMFGATDGWDITEMDPVRNTLIDGQTEANNYAYNTIKEAIDIVKDPEFVEYNLVTIPNLTANSLTAHLLQTVEARADALAIIDLEGDFQPASEGASSPVGSVTLGDVDDTINRLQDRGLNTSYGCAYYPYVQIRDTLTSDLVYMPPSVAAFGAMSYTDRVKAPWFAPAGFNRGGLSTGIAGLPVFGVTDKLTSKDRDKLYDANINPIASFPNEGIVIFGQKTLQVTRSALDRINVRRLLIFVKKGISHIAKDMLFEPNVQETWDRFISRAEPFLADVKARFGVTDYKLVLDKTTTTPDMIDQNIMYAKIFMKPARAIEFIAVDFVITNTGAAFED